MADSDNDRGYMSASSSELLRLFSGISSTSSAPDGEAVCLSDELFRAVLHLSPFTLAAQDCDLRYTWVHPPVSQGTLAPALQLGRTDLECMPPEDAEPLVALKRGVLESGRGAHAEVRVGARTLDLMIEPLRDPRGVVIGLLSASADITPRKQAEQEHEQLLAELDAEKARWRATVESMLDAVTVADAAGQATYMNPAYSRMIGRTIEPGLDLEAHAAHYQLYHPDGTLYNPVDLPLQRAALNGESVRNVELVQRTAWGDARVSVWNAAPLTDPDGRPAGAVAVGRDVTEQRRAEDHLRTSLDNLLDGFAILTAVRNERGLPIDFRYEYINEIGSRMNQRPRVEHIGHTIMELLPANESSMLINAYARVEETGEPFMTESLDYEDVYGEGRRLRRAFDVRAFKLGDGFAVTWRDVTERKRGEEAQRVNLTKYAVLFDAFPLGIVVGDAQGAVVEANQEAERLLGVPAEELKRRHIGDARWRVLRADGTPMAPAEYPGVRALKEGQRVENVEMGIVGHGGETNWMSVTSAPLPVEGYGAVVTYTDIGERRRAEERVLSMARFPIENPSPILRMDLAGRVLFSNGASDTLLAGGEALALLREESSVALATQTRRDVEVEFDERVYAFRVVPMPDAGYVNFYGVDVTARKRAEQAITRALARSKELYETSRRIGLAQTPGEVLNALLDTGYLRGSARASVAEFSRPWLDDADPPEALEVVAEYNRYPGWPSAIGVVSRLDRDWLARVPMRQQPTVVEDIASMGDLSVAVRAHMTALGLRSMVTLPLIAGGVRYGLLSFLFDQPRRMEEEDLRHLQGLADQAAVAIYNLRLLAREAAARREAEQATEHMNRLYEAEAAARREADRQNELRLRFLGMVSHELRTPLASIKGFASTLLATDVTWDAESQLDFIRTIDSESDKLTDMIDQILDLARLEAGTLQVKQKVVHWRDIVTVASPHLSVVASGHPLALSVPGVLPPVRADSQRVAQVLVNLVGNAAKYTPAGTPIEVTALSDGMFVRVSVRDEGPGIAPEDLPHVFEAFRRGRKGLAYQAKGAGLGLAICKGIVEAHGGRIWIEPRTGPGTVVSFTLPVAG